MATTEAVVGTDTVFEHKAEREELRVFSGPPVFTDAITSYLDDDWENAKTETITRWAVCLFRDGEDPQRWVTADVIGFPGVASEGATEDEAMANVREALKLALESLGEGELIEMPAKYVIPSGGRVVFAAL